MREHAMGCPCATCSKKPWNEIYQLGYQRGRRDGLEEAAKDIELDLCERDEPFCICAERAAAIRALAEGERKGEPK